MVGDGLQDELSGCLLWKPVPEGKTETGFCSDKRHGEQ